MSGAGNRQSSISFSCTNEQNFDTVFTLSYVDPGRQCEDDVKAFQQNKKYLRGHHFELGATKTNYDSSHKQSFPKHEHIDVVKPTATGRGSSFQLGYQQDPSNFYETTFTRDMRHPPASKFDLIKKPQSGHGICFGTDTDRYESEYQMQCRTSKEGNAHADDGHTFVNASEKSKELRKSNFIFGTDDPPFVSTVQDTFGCMPSADPPTRVCNDDIRKQHVHLGSQKAEYQSTMNKDFGDVDQLLHACKNPSRLNDAQKADLRTHHFSFGKDAPEVKSVSQDAYPEFHDPNAAAKAAKLQKETADVRANMQKCNIDFGSRLTHWASTAKETYDTKDIKEAQGAKVEVDRRSHIVFGNDTEDCKQDREISMGQRDMRQGIVGSEYGNTQLSTCARHTSVCIGTDKSIVRSTAQDSYVHFKDVEPAAMSKEVIKDLRATHYTLGTDTDGYKDLQSSTQSAMRFRQPDKTEKPKRKEEDARHANISLGNYKVDYVSTLQENFSWPAKDTAA